MSCRIRGSGKIASLCASAGASETTGHVDYRFGTRSRVELVFPKDRGPPVGRFKVASFQRAGGVGSGYAYSFETDGWKYAMYSINSKTGEDDFGLIVGPARGSHPFKVLHCEQKSAVETSSDSLLAFTHGWPRDQDLDGIGLPSAVR